MIAANSDRRVIDCAECDPAGPTCERCVTFLDQEQEIARLRAERDADRAAAAALVAALPKCDVCGAPATRACIDDFACDVHSGCNWSRLGYADALDALQARMASWGAEVPR